MSITIKINDRTSGETKQYSLQDIQPTETVAAVKARIAQQDEVSASQLNVIYCGQMLQDNCLLTKYEIKHGVTLYVLPSGSREQATPAQVNKPTVREIQTAVKSMLKFHSIMEKVSRSHKFQDELMSKVPGLATDPLAMSMLQEPDVVEMLMDPYHLEKLTSATPCINPAVIILSEEVKKVVESKGGKVKRTLRRQHFSLDAIQRENMNDMFMFNEDGEFDETYEWEGQGDFIPPEFFAQALNILDEQQPGADGNDNNPAPYEISEENIQILQAMGIYDMERVRQALQVTGGNLEVAIGFLYKDH